MSLYKITPDDVETFTIVATPKKSFSSNSNGEVTGTVNLFARRSDIEKEVVPLSLFEQSFFNDKDINQLLKQVKNAASGSTNFESEISQYLNEVNSQTSSARKQKQLNIKRFEPSLVFGKDSLKKRSAQIMMGHYRNVYPEMNWAYTNYNCLNFFTGSELPTSSTLLYPNSQSLDYPSGVYSPQSAFTFEFYINPRYTTDSENSDFKAGTIMHLSSTYAISLHSGSSRDSTGKVDGYKISLQLSHSADISPSLAVNGNYPNDLIFFSPDNSLKRNHWHHVAIRWGTNSINEGSGSFFVDGTEVSTFVVPSGTIVPAPYAVPQGDPSVLCLGNYYEGSNSGTFGQDLFFNTNPATRDGLINLAPSFNQEAPDAFDFTHPLNAELHEIKLYDTFRLTENIISDSLGGSSVLDNLRLYVPPFFVKESPFRQVLNNQGGVLQTPFQAINSTTDDPFNVALSFGVGGHYINLENSLRDFANGIYPRQMFLTASQITDDAPISRTANEYMYLTGSVRKRNVTLLPCDNGIFTPNFNLLRSGTVSVSPSSGSAVEKFVNDLGHLDLSLVSLNNLVPTSSYNSGLDFQSGSIIDGIAGATPENPGVAPQGVLTVLQRTRDTSSNEVTFFDISNIYFGNRINPGSFQVKDTSVTGSSEKVSITLKDNGYGGLYRGDCLTAQATWNNVGNIFYNEGLIAVKTPNIPFFGKEQFEMSFEGEQTVHVLKLSAEAGTSLINSSSNPNYQAISASLNANENDSKFVYISNLDFMDENLNVVMKTSLAQPLKKRNSDKALFTIKMDF